MYQQSFSIFARRRFAIFGLRLTLGVATLLAFSLALASNARAQSQRVFVSSSGDDANNCKLTTPCRTFAGALSKVTAGGEIIALDSAGYGTLTINKSVSIIAPYGVYAGITATSGTAVYVFAGDTDVVVLRGLTINGMGASDGVILQKAGALHVENCVVNGFSNAGVGATPNFNSPTQLFVKETVVRDGGTSGIFVSPNSGTVSATIDHCRMEKNSGDGLQVVGTVNVRVTVRDSVAAGNGSVGFHVISFGGTAELNLENCLAAGNGQGIAAGGPSGLSLIRASNSASTGNNFGIMVGINASILSRGNNTVEGNTTNGAFSGLFSAK